MSNIVYFSNCELWPFKKIPAGIIFKLQIVSLFILAVNHNWPESVVQVSD